MRAFVILFLLLIPSMGFAQSSQTKDVAKLEAALKTQSELSDAAAKDKQLAAGFIADAKKSIQTGDSERAAIHLRRAAFAVELVTALVTAAVIRQQAEAQEAAAFSAPQTVDQLNQEVEAMRRKKAELEAEVKRLGGGS